MAAIGSYKGFGNANTGILVGGDFTPPSLPYSMAAWVKVFDLTATGAIVGFQDTQNVRQTAATMIVTSGKGSARVSDGGATDNPTGGATAFTGDSEGTFQLIVANYYGSSTNVTKGEVSVNGAAFQDGGTINKTGPSDSTHTYVCMGGFGFGAGSLFRGRICQVGIWSGTTLTASDVANMYTTRLRFNAIQPGTIWRYWEWTNPGGNKEIDLVAGVTIGGMGTWTFTAGDAPTLSNGGGILGLYSNSGGLSGNMQSLSGGMSE